MPARCWNQEIIAGMAETLDEPWQGFLRSLIQFFQQRRDTVKTIFERAIRPLETLDCNDYADPSNFRS